MVILAFLIIVIVLFLSHHPQQQHQQQETTKCEEGLQLQTLYNYGPGRIISGVSGSNKKHNKTTEN